MEERGIDCVLAIPCLNESQRLPAFLSELCDCILRSPYRVQIQIVDDGSPKDEQSRLAELVTAMRNEYPIVGDIVFFRKNRGKGAAIREAWSLYRGRTKRYAFVDADGAVPASEVVRLIGRSLGPDSAGMVVASRYATDSNCERSLSRDLLARSFSALVSLRYDIGVLDTQCGCKVLTAGFYEAVEPLMKEEGFGFDLELIIRAQEQLIDIEEVGVRWVEVPGSKVSMGSIFRLGASVLLASIGR